MNDEKKYIDESGHEWIRQFGTPQASFDTKWDENSSRDFVEKSGRKKGTMGELWEKSAELSEQREKYTGQDLIKLKANEEYKKKHRGIELESFRRKKLKDSINNNPNCPIELDI